MADYHNLGVRPYQSLFHGIEYLDQHNVWFTEYNFRDGQNKMEFYYNWFRVIRFLITLMDYSVQHERNKTTPSYKIEFRSDLDREFWGEYPRVALKNEYYNRIIISTSFQCYNPLSPQFVDISNVKPVSFAIQQLAEQCLYSLWKFIKKRKLNPKKKK